MKQSHVGGSKVYTHYESLQSNSPFTYQTLELSLTSLFTCEQWELFNPKIWFAVVALLFSFNIVPRVLFPLRERTLDAAGHVPPKLWEVFQMNMVREGWQWKEIWLWETYCFRVREEFATSISWSPYKTAKIVPLNSIHVNLLWVDYVVEIFFTREICPYFPLRKKFLAVLLSTMKQISRLLCRPCESPITNFECF